MYPLVTISMVAFVLTLRLKLELMPYSKGAVGSPVINLVLSIEPCPFGSTVPCTSERPMLLNVSALAMTTPKTPFPYDCARTKVP